MPSLRPFASELGWVATVGCAGAHVPPHLLHRLGTQVHAHILEGPWPSVLDRQRFEEEPEDMGFFPEGTETFKCMTTAQYRPNCV